MPRTPSPRSTRALAQVPQDKRPRVYLARGPDGLETGLRGSINTEIIERVGGRNVAEAAAQRRARPGLAGAGARLEPRGRSSPGTAISTSACATTRPGPASRAVRDGPRLSAPRPAFRLDRPPPSLNRADRPALAGRRCSIRSASPATCATARESSTVCSIRSSRASRSSTACSHGRGPRALIRPRRGAAPYRPLLRLALLACRDAVASLVGPLSAVARRHARALCGALTGAPATPARADRHRACSRCGCRGSRAALLVGAALAAAGAAYQSLFRNPLVSPDILGVSAGAGLGAVLGIFLSLPVVGIQLLAFVGGLAAVGARLRASPPRCAAAIRCWCWCWPASSSARSPAPASRCSRSWPIPTTSCRRSPSGCWAASPASRAGDVRAALPAGAARPRAAGAAALAHQRAVAGRRGGPGAGRRGRAPAPAW